MALRRSQNIRGELELLDDVGFLLTAAMWFVFVFGTVSVIALSEGVPLGLVRLLPVVFPLLGCRFSWPERVLLGWLGPRGTTSIVFGPLAVDELEWRRPDPRHRCACRRPCVQSGPSQ